ncbi:CPBP family glutamic-type intramembrane protease [Limimaricola sp.]|uniref:CPBP family glutamic-type intramembrane protease n=1 Tax=Limimaricola sp. TaxID=2211665 RepID=UPI0025BFA95D|nr:CPBP family glutamic-type intramembrane protease [Limimaricola sp.]
MTIATQTCLVLLALGLLGAASLALAPLERLAPAGARLSPRTFRLVATLQPALLVSLGVALGCGLGGTVGLGAPALRAALDGTNVATVLARQIGPALAVAVLAAAMIRAYAALGPAAKTPAPFALPLTTRILYGGLAEELMMRWGLMSLLAWAGWQLAGRPETLPATAAWAAIILAALVFAAGHLPLLARVPSGWRARNVLLVMVGNTVPGIGFGWLFLARGIEAAMLSHALAHVLAWALEPRAPAQRPPAP